MVTLNVRRITGTQAALEAAETQLLHPHILKQHNSNPQLVAAPSSLSKPSSPPQIQHRIQTKNGAEDVLRQAHAANLAGVIDQIGKSSQFTMKSAFNVVIASASGISCL